MDIIKAFPDLARNYFTELLKGPYDGQKFRKLGGMLAMFGFVAYQFMRYNGLLPKKSLRNEIVFISGAGSGIGKKVAIFMARQGAKIACVDINTAAADATRDLITSEGNVAISCTCDVCDVASIKSAGDLCREKLGDPTILINNAGIVSGKKILENELSKMELVMKVNTISHFYTLKEFLPSMLKKNHGHVITVASIAGHLGVKSMVDYCASKFGAVGVHESLRSELRGLGSRVRATCICPYYINTGMFEGVNPGLLGFLEEDKVAMRIINGIRQNETMVIMPWLLHFSIMLKGLLPEFLADFLMDVFKANSSMDEFTGRK